MTPSRPGATITRLELLLLLALGMALRITWMTLVHAWTDPVDLGEASRAAAAFARHGYVGDAYFSGQGPSAHFLPMMIVIAGTVQRLLGPGSAAANIALSLWTLLQVATGFVLTVALFRRLGAERRTLLGGLGLLCLVPACIAQEAADFRVWEGALAYDLAAANLLWIRTLAGRFEIRARDLAIGAFAAALAFFVNPPAGLAICASWALFAVTRLPLFRAAQFALLAAAAMAMLIVPWAVRNRALLGETVLLRSNFGLELAIANYDGAIAPASPRAALTARMDAVHQTRQRFEQAGGEIAYSRKVGAEAWGWIAAHPVDFVRLSVRHYRQFYVPDTWEEFSTNWNGANRVRIMILQLVGVLGLAGLAVGLARKRSGYGMLAAYVAVAGLPYALVQPIPRHGYIIYPLLGFLAVQLVADVTAAIRRRARGARGRPVGAPRAAPARPCRG